MISENRELTQRQKIIQAQREIKKITKDLERMMMIDVDYTINNIQMGDDWYLEGSKKFVNMMRDRYLQKMDQ